MTTIAELVEPSAASNTTGTLPPSLMRKSTEKKYPSRHDLEMMFEYHVKNRSPRRVAHDVFDSCLEHDPLFAMGCAAPCADGKLGWYAFETHTAPYGDMSSRVSCTIYVLSVLHEQQAGISVSTIKDIFIHVPGFGAHRIPLTWNNRAFMVNAANHNMYYAGRSWKHDIETCRSFGKSVPKTRRDVEPSAIIELIQRTVRSAYKAE